MNPQLKEALERLDSALDRLDQAVQARGTPSGGAHEEAAALADRLHLLEAQHRSAEETRRAVAGRLDVAIARIDTVLQE